MVGRRPGLEERIVAVCVVTGVVAAGLFWLVHHVLLDAYITLSYARNVAFHLH